MQCAMFDRRILKNGDIIGTRLIKVAEKSMVVDVCAETKRMREQSDEMESRIEEAVLRATKTATRQAAQKATLEVITQYSSQHNTITDAIKGISKQLVESVAEALEVTLTPEQITTILGSAILKALSSESLPSVAVRVNPELIDEFESWLGASCPENLREKIAIFPHDNIPLDRLVVRADSTITEIAVGPMIAARAREAAAAIAMDLGIVTSSTN